MRFASDDVAEFVYIYNGNRLENSSL
jgi:hypothetical protein